MITFPANKKVLLLPTSTSKGKNRSIREYYYEGKTFATGGYMSTTAGNLNEIFLYDDITMGRTIKPLI